MNLPRVTVIIPNLKVTETLHRCIKSVLAQDYPNDLVEIIVVTTTAYISPYDRVRFINGGIANPPEARNIAAKKATGEIVAYTDDDCIMPSSWIRNAVQHFKDPSVAGVGGSGRPAESSSCMTRCANYVIQSPMGTLNARRRYGEGNDANEEGSIADENDLILCNTFLRRRVLEEVGGFDGDQVPCEENELYHRILRAGYKLLFLENIAVTHSIRPLFSPLLKRIRSYATGRGILTCRFPKTFHWIYGIPSLGLLTFMTGLFLSFYHPSIALLTALLATAYFSSIFLQAITIFFKKERNMKLFIIIPCGIALMHLAYATGFLWGILRFVTGTWKQGKIGKYYSRFEHFERMDLRNVGSFNTIKNWARGKILDVGCGIGYLTQFIEAVGVDISTDALKHSHLEMCVVASASHLPFTRCFDTIVAYNILEHLTDDLRNMAFIEFHRTLKENGLFIASYIDEKYWLNRLRAFISFGQGSADPTHCVSWRIDDFLAEVQNHGFEIIEQRRTSPYGKFIPVTRFFHGEAVLRAKTGWAE